MVGLSSRFGCAPSFTCGSVLIGGLSSSTLVSELALMVLVVMRERCGVLLDNADALIAESIPLKKRRAAAWLVTAHDRNRVLFGASMSSWSLVR